MCLPKNTRENMARSRHPFNASTLGYIHQLTFKAQMADEEDKAGGDALHSARKTLARCLVPSSRSSEHDSIIVRVTCVAWCSIYAADRDSVVCSSFSRS